MGLRKLGVFTGTVSALSRLIQYLESNDTNMADSARVTGGQTPLVFGQSALRHLPLPWQTAIRCAASRPKLKGDHSHSYVYFLVIKEWVSTFDLTEWQSDAVGEGAEYG